MAVTYGFYNSLNGDRKYYAEQMSSIFNGIITDGVFSAIGDALMTVAGSATSMQVIVKTGRAWFNGTWTQNDAQLPLDIPTADVSLTRIDAVVLEVNTSNSVRANSIKVVKGTASANPQKPTLTNENLIHQYALAYVTVPAGATSITASNIEVNVGKTGCPFITSVLQQADITDVFNQWEAEFDEWFANVKSTLSGDVATNLQRQIDERVKISDKATFSDLYNGSEGKWIDTKLFKDKQYQIGDVLLTARDDLDDRWIKCDGRVIDKASYPELNAMFKGNDNIGGYAANVGMLNAIPTGSYVMHSGNILYMSGSIVYLWKTDGTITLFTAVDGLLKTNVILCEFKNNGAYYYVLSHEAINGSSTSTRVFYIINDLGKIVTEVTVNTGSNSTDNTFGMSASINGGVCISNSLDIAVQFNQYIYAQNAAIDLSVKSQTLTVTNQYFKRLGDNSTSVYSPKIYGSQLWYLSHYSGSYESYFLNTVSIVNNSNTPVYTYIYTRLGSTASITIAKIYTTGTDIICLDSAYDGAQKYLRRYHLDNDTAKILELSPVSVPDIKYTSIFEDKLYMNTQNDGLLKIDIGTFDVDNLTYSTIFCSPMNATPCPFSIGKDENAYLVNTFNINNYVYSTKDTATPVIAFDKISGYIKGRYS